MTREEHLKETQELRKAGFRDRVNDLRALTERFGDQAAEIVIATGNHTYIRGIKFGTYFSSIPKQYPRKRKIKLFFFARNQPFFLKQCLDKLKKVMYNRKNIFPRRDAMNKAELVDAIAKKSGLTKKDCEKGLTAFMETVKTVLKKGDKVSLVGFGTFQVMNRKATTGVNPKTKEKINIPAKKVAKLKVSANINDSLNKKK